MLRKSEKLAKPTDGELEILTVLWEKGPSTVREIHEVLEKRKRTGRTTVLKLVQIMTEKGILNRDENTRPHRFSSKPSPEATRTHLVDDLLGKAFGGSAEMLVMHVLKGKATSPDEIKAVQELLERLEKAR